MFGFICMIHGKAKSFLCSPCFYLVQSFRHVFQFYWNQKVYNHHFLDYDLGCTLHCNVHLYLNIDVFNVISLELGGLKSLFINSLVCPSRSRNRGSKPRSWNWGPLPRRAWRFSERRQRLSVCPSRCRYWFQNLDERTGPGPEIEVRRSALG
jgi:hypothetical protein